MDTQISAHDHVLDIHADQPITEKVVGKSKVCAGVTCGFSDAKTNSSDEKERLVSMKKLLIEVILCIVFMAVEVVGGIKANSLAIMTDAAHLLSDVVAFAISLFSLWASGWGPNSCQSYGFFRIEILGALVSLQLIWLLAGILVYEAIARLLHNTGEVQGFFMFAVSAFGLVVNILMAILLGHDHGHGHEHGHQDEEHIHSHGVNITRHHHHHEGHSKVARKM